MFAPLPLRSRFNGERLEATFYRVSLSLSTLKRFVIIIFLFITRDIFLPFSFTLCVQYFVLQKYDRLN